MKNPLCRFRHIIRHFRIYEAKIGQPAMLLTHNLHYRNCQNSLLKAHSRSILQLSLKSCSFYDFPPKPRVCKLGLGSGTPKTYYCNVIHARVITNAKTRLEAAISSHIQVFVIHFAELDFIPQ